MCAHWAQSGRGCCPSLGAGRGCFTPTAGPEGRCPSVSPAFVGLGGALPGGGAGVLGSPGRGGSCAPPSRLFPPGGGVRSPPWCSATLLWARASRPHTPPTPVGFFVYPRFFSAWGGGVGWGVLWRVGRLPPPSRGRGGVPSTSGLGEGHCPSLLSPAWGLWGTAAWVTTAWGHIQRRLRCLCGGPSPPVSLAAGWSTGGSPPSVVPRTRAGRGALSHGGGP